MASGLFLLLLYFYVVNINSSPPPPSRVTVTFTRRLNFRFLSRKPSSLKLRASYRVPDDGSHALEPRLVKRQHSCQQ